MNLDKLAVFVDAVRMGSFHKAAEKYFYTPSALSRLADGLEKELGVKLIQRSPSGVLLTKEGATLFPYLEELLRQKQELFAAAETLSQKRTTLTVGCYSSVSTSLLPDMILQFQQMAPGVKISVVVGNTVADMRRKGAEICFADEGERKDSNFLLVTTDEYVAVVKEGYFSGKRSVTADDFSTYTFLMPADRKVEERFTPLAREITDVVADDDSVIVSMVKNGLGISVLPYLSVKNHPRGVRLIKLSPPLYRALGAIYGDKLSAAAKKLLRFLVERT